ncbi:hypothetical protein HDV57DRAFT_500191 [Trichoderma longibrachiatum]
MTLVLCVMASFQPRSTVAFSLVAAVFAWLGSMQHSVSVGRVYERKLYRHRLAIFRSNRTPSASRGLLGSPKQKRLKW